MDAPTPQTEFWSRPVVSTAKTAGLYLILALYLSNPIHRPADSPGDPSFQQALTYFTAESMQAGRDYVFTYGPLGHFLIPRYQPGMFWLDWLVGLAMGLLAAWPVFKVLRDETFPRIDRFAVVIALLLLARAGPGPELPYLVSAFLMVVLLRRGSERQPAPLVFFAVALAFLSLGKFTMMVLSVGFIGYLTIQFALSRRYAEAALISISYVASLPLLWLLAWQDLSNLPRFLLDSLEISRAYNSGMFLEGILVRQALGALSLTAALAATLPLLWNERRRLCAVADAVFVLVYVYILWKSGMIRNGAHEAKLFAPLMLLPMMVALPGGAGALVSRLRNAAVSLAIGCGVAGTLLSNPFGISGALTAPAEKIARAGHQYFAPWSRHETLGQLWRERTIFDAWPKTKKLVGDRTLDIFPPEQRLVFFNNFNYRPRYVFQGYQACTPRLLELNAQSYWGTGPAPAPDFVLFRVIPIDYRLPNTEDSQAMLALFYAYRPVLLEQGLVLFERRENPPEKLPPTATISEGSLTPGERLVVPETPGQWQLLSLEFDQTPGLLSAATAYKIQLEYSNGKTAEYRIVPSLTILPFLFNRTWPEGSPMRENNDYFDEQVVSFSIHGESGNLDGRVGYWLLAIEPPEV